MRIKQKIGLILIAAAFTLALLLAGGCAVKTEGTTQQVELIKIGVMLPLSGDVAPYGLAVQKGIEMAKKELNLNVRLVYEDTKCSGKDAVTAITKLATVDGVTAIVGEICSSATLPAAPLANQYEVPMISPASSSPKIKDAGDYIFRVIPSDALQGDFAANLIYRKGYRKVGVIHTNEDYGLGFATVLQESFKKLGGEVVAVEKMDSGSVDVRTQLLKIKDANADAVSIASNSPDSSVAVLKQMKELGMTTQAFGSEALYGQYMLDNGKDAAEGLLVTSVTTGTAGFREKYKAQYGSEPDPFTAQGYDAMYAIGLAVQQGAKTGKEIKEKVYANEFDGATGKVKFDNYGEVAGVYDVYKVEADKWVLANK